ncbi:hypothetical protein C8J57DRAFT_1358131 [Mycena rebaudengoi]|nr:hypothetical protein C8J57DRAFT_1358131 [Mycena rebaudengoi]
MELFMHHLRSRRLLQNLSQIKGILGTRWPLLLRIVHANFVVDYDGVDTPFGLLEIHFLLDVSWDDLRATICALRAVPGALEHTIEFLSDEELPWASLMPTVATELFCGSVHLLKGIRIGEQPKYILDYCHLPWGHLLRASPHSPELLLEVRNFVPPFEDECLDFDPSDFHNVLQWLKAFSDPPLDLISRWEGYLSMGCSRYHTTLPPFDDLEEIWRRCQDRLARYGFTRQ